jgi:5'-methylthioadenosine phosphorylase
MKHDTQAEIGVIGGSGLYEFLEKAEEVTVDTPFGEPSGPLTIGTVNGRAVAFVPRHGPDHRYQPHRIPYRANVWALRAVGVEQVLAPCAVGSLDPRCGPGTLVLPDQVVDRTAGRPRTFYDHDGGVHAPFADPYCADVRAVVRVVAAEQGWPPVATATMVVIEGPAFSTRAESRWYAAQGWRVVGMTGCPEAVLARELGLCYAPVAVVTDLDAGLAEGEGVNHQEVLANFAKNIDRLRHVLAETIGRLPGTRSCGCHEAVTGFPATPSPALP